MSQVMESFNSFYVSAVFLHHRKTENLWFSYFLRFSWGIERNQNEKIHVILHIYIRMKVPACVVYSDRKMSLW